MSDDRLPGIEIKLDRLVEDQYELRTDVKLLANDLSNHLKQDTENLQSISLAIGGMKESLDAYNKELAVHIRRCEALEESNSLLRDQLSLDRQSFEQRSNNQSERLEAVERPLKWLSDSKKLVAALASIIAVSAGLIKLVTWLLTSIAK